MKGRPKQNVDAFTYDFWKGFARAGGITSYSVYLVGIQLSNTLRVSATMTFNCWTLEAAELAGPLGSVSPVPLIPYWIWFPSLCEEQ